MMHHQCAALLQALDNLGATQAELAKITLRSDPRRRHDLVVQRRVLASQAAKVGELGNTIFVELGDPLLLSNFRKLTSAARSKAALHQANWSAVRIDDSSNEYRMSAKVAGEAHLLLSDWLRSTIADIINK